MPTSNLKKVYAKNITLIRFLFSLLVNAFTFLGIIVWKWSFFTVIYLYWAEEVIRIIFKLIENKVAHQKNKKIPPKERTISNEQLRYEYKSTKVMLFPMAIYFVFIIVIVGIIASPNSDATIDNLRTVFFKNMEFNLNLLLALISEIVILFYLFNKNVKNKFEKQSDSLDSTSQLDAEKEFLRKQREEDVKSYAHQHQEKYNNGKINTQNLQFSTQMIVLHLSIILGTFFYFAANTDKLPIQINLGVVGQFAFVIVFAAVQTIAEVLVFLKKGKEA
ncbi:DUF6498-containing protein [Bernardetia sp.]|uniref:DUF6498-containing protein n=1 Tax=Bernardetia sp. TaxID=1937974 RepID=UPI0025C6856A|nr:DUF6498-containing protein [Bernardetia sp.]